MPDDVSASAALHGVELFGVGFTVSQVVHEYGDVCQAITTLAEEQDAHITIAEFRVLNRTLDTAIAQAVTAYSCVTGDSAAADEADRLGHAIHNLRETLDAAVSRFDAHAARRKYRHE